MAVVITVAQQKGGTGKSTLAANIAAAFASDRRVGLLDIDPQKSLGRWHSLRRARLQQTAALAFSDISGWRLPAELDRLKRDHDVVLIDSPPQLDTDARVAVRAADVVIVPIQPSMPDVWAAEGTLRLAADERRPAHLMFNRTASNVKAARYDRRRPRRAQRAAAAFGAWQPRRLRACIRRRPRGHRGRAALHRRRGVARTARRTAGADGMNVWGWVLAVHVLCAVIWVGGMFFAYVVLRPSLSVLEPIQRIALHTQVFRRFFLVIWHAMPLILLSGFAVLFGFYGGPAFVGWNVHLMMLLGLIMSGVFLLIVFGPYARFRRTTDRNTAAASIDRIRKLIAVNLVLGIVTVVVALLRNP